MGRYTGKKCRLISMLWLTAVFFFVEIIVGYITNSMALVADSFHMLSDVAALVVAFLSVKMSPKKWSKNTFGWARAEVLGALVNAVFLVALCFSITLEACKRFIELQTIHDPQLLVAVGALGLFVNIIGLFLFHEHGGGSHSHGGGGAARIKSRNRLSRLVATDDNENDENFQPPPPTTAGHNHGHSHSDAHQMNMRGVFLHVLSDALGSVIVICSAIVFWLTDWKYKFYIDPALSILLVLLILHSVWPLLRESALILLQTVPTHIQVDAIQRRLLTKVDGVLAVHEFHVWQLAGDRIIASAHIRCRNLSEYMKIAEKVKEFFHNEGIHSTTIQPEFVELDDYLDTDTQTVEQQMANCALNCPRTESDTCDLSTCCGPAKIGVESYIVVCIASGLGSYMFSQPFCPLYALLDFVQAYNEYLYGHDESPINQEPNTILISLGRETPSPNDTPYMCRQRNSATSFSNHRIQTVSEMEEGALLPTAPPIACCGCTSTIDTMCTCPPLVTNGPIAKESCV